ncbi:MAG: nifR3 family TIM-barrel protein [Pseudohongiellaceae bacterium]|jgi:nifR3 family TIM-barrel protein
MARLMPTRSQINADVPLAAPGEFAPLSLGEKISVWPPVVLAPMAGVTNPPYRSLCRRQGAGLYVAEMLHARGLAERDQRTVSMASFGDDETVRSIQIFGSDPVAMGGATEYLVEELGVHHVDINMGCPVRKVTARGGGSALPARPQLMARCLAAVVKAAGSVPVTVKMRLGLDDEHFTWQDAVDIAADEGAKWIGVHARTAAQLYSGNARWEVLGDIKARARLPVLGNGDIWESFDALRMMRSTGVDGVIIGRGCLGRPWLFRELADVFEGREPAEPPSLGEVLKILREHGRLLVDFFGERKGVLELRKWCAWYTKGFPNSSQARNALQRIESLAAMDELLAGMDPSLPFPQKALRISRGKRGGSQEKVALPPSWLDLAARESVDQRAPTAQRDDRGSCK